MKAKSPTSRVTSPRRPAEPTGAEGSVGTFGAGGASSGGLTAFFFLGSTGASFTPTSSTGFTSSSLGGGGNGETFGGALRAGTPLGQHWGVELEFARTGEIEMMPGGVFPATGFEWSSEASGTFPITSVTSLSILREARANESAPPA